VSDERVCDLGEGAPVEGRWWKGVGDEPAGGTEDADKEAGRYGGSARSPPGADGSDDQQGSSAGEETDGEVEETSEIDGRAG
jgi:hypothetical protein